MREGLLSEPPFLAKTGSRGSSNDTALWHNLMPVVGAVHPINSGRARQYNSLEEAKVLIEQWRGHYNTLRPHSTLGYRPRASQTIASHSGDRPFAQEGLRADHRSQNGG